MNKPFDFKISVCMITYNHSLYVAEALESIFKQKTNFQIEVVIGDDASSDETVSIIKSLIPPANVRLKLIPRSKNVGMVRNFVSTFEQCTGEYIALLEGDDYWIDENKLARQVLFLDSNRDFSICYHPVKFNLQNKKIIDNIDKRDVTDIYELAKGNFIHTCSVVFRNKLFNCFPSTIYNSTVVDYFLHMLNAQYGNIKKLPYSMAVYRIHENGVWSMQSNMDIKIIKYLEAMIGCFPDDVEVILKNRYHDIAYKSFYNRINEEGIHERFLRCIKYDTTNIEIKLKSLINSEKKNNNKIINKLKKYFFNSLSRNSS